SHQGFSVGFSGSPIAQHQGPRVLRGSVLERDGRRRPPEILPRGPFSSQGVLVPRSRHSLGTLVRFSPPLAGSRFSMLSAPPSPDAPPRRSRAMNAGARFLKRHWFLVCLALALVVGMSGNETMARVAEIGQVRSGVVAVVLFLMG